jgi:hypothetical protein
MKTLIATLILLFAPALAHASTVRGIFGGTIERLGIGFGFSDPFGDDYGLGIEAGDAFIGNFSYDTNTTPTYAYSSPYSFVTPQGSIARAATGVYPATSFSVQIGDLQLTAINNSMGVIIADITGYMTSFWMLGQLTVGEIDFPCVVCPGGLFMSVGLGMAPTSWPITNNSPPTYLSDKDWGLACFKISPFDSPAIEHHCGFEIEAILRLSGTLDTVRPDSEFFLRTIPEPPAWWLLGLGLMGISMVRIVIPRRQHG